MTKDDAKAAFLILESAEQGRPVEFLAQYIASYILSGELDGDQVIDFIVQLVMRCKTLTDYPSKIWQPLLPGGDMGMPAEFRFTVVDEVDGGTAIGLLSKAVESGQLNDTLIGMEIVRYLASPDRYRYTGSALPLHDQESKPKNIVITYGLAIYDRDRDNVWFSDGAEFFQDEMGEPWVKFVPKNGYDKGQEHIVHMNNISHFVRRED